MRSLIAFLLLSVGCVDQLDPEPRTPDLFGEACLPDPYPAATVCHAARGWCINQICRPMCVDARCEFGVKRYADSGACYCEP